MSGFGDTTRANGVDDATQRFDELVTTTDIPTPPPAPPASTIEGVDTDAAVSRPTVRWGALVWSLIFAGIAATTLWVVVDSGRRTALGDWLLDLSPVAAWLYALLVLGVLVVVFGLVALIRRREHAARQPE